MDLGIITLTEEQKMILGQVRDFARKEIAPKAAHTDQTGEFPRGIVKQMGEMGLMGLNVEPEFGGAGLDYLTYALVGEELNAACASTGVIFSAHNSLACGPLKKWGTSEQKRKWLEPLASGKRIGCFALSEPGSGSDAGALICKSVKQGNEWVINGTKNWITNGPESDTMIVLTTMDTALKHKGVCAFVIDKSTPGVSVGKVEHKLGIKGSGTSQLIFENVKVGDDQMLGKPGDGFKIAMTTLDAGRVGIAAQAIGIARAALEAAKKFAHERETFGKPIGQHQGIQFMIADMAMRLDAARLLLWRAAMMQDKGMKFTREAAMAKLFASEAANFICDKALQIHGGYGYVNEYPVERHYRDQRITEIYEGTSEIQRLVIAAAELNPR
ncbi:MAG: acyl-CoA dehydrogenase [Bdellovibrionales bacterium]|nr:acyl-CoA dehydrogenase [Bdellovibrionales bacterium]